MNKNPSPKTIKRIDYRAPSFRLDTVDLKFHLQKEITRVHSRLCFQKNLENDDQELHLDGIGLKLISLRLDGVKLESKAYVVDEKCLTIAVSGSSCILEIEVEIEPHKNTRLEGLYQSSGNYCTQCEAQGFRRITYFPDRPDVLSVFSVEINADKKQYPILLSNGNRVGKGDLEGGRHWVRWDDPFPKPSYLFALIAGDLACISDNYKTISGRDVELNIFVQHHNKDKCDFAMQSLKKSMAWDEQRFALEYDLDIYMIVAVDDFNMGAMENKGLNVFNSKFVLADRKSATDSDFEGIESVIGHEYFHNWTGNRVTCRDWFQLSLKEGLTVFRDQEFSADLNSRAVKRINDVRQLRARQFPEDASPMAHPIRPDYYIEINNFYTATVYEKGAEVIRMMHTLLGETAFRVGLELYFNRHDGQAVTCEDFIVAMEDASYVDLTLFRNWYSYAGTPTLKIETQYDETRKEFRLNIQQVTKTHSHKQNFHMPFVLGLINNAGAVQRLQLAGETQSCNEITLDIKKQRETFTFVNVENKPVPSLLRNFCAPVILEYDYSDNELAFLMRFDADSFNRWESGQRLATRIIMREMQSLNSTASADIDPGFSQAVARTLEITDKNVALRAESLLLPSIETIAELQDEVNMEVIHLAREKIRHQIANAHQEKLLALYAYCQDKQSDDLDAAAMGIRRLKNICLHYITALDSKVWKELLLQQYNHAKGMTDSLAALREISHSDIDERAMILENFYSRWKKDRLVIDKWFTIQATSVRQSTLNNVVKLTQHPDFDTSNPNRVRSLIGAFAIANPVCFHAVDGRGYEFLADYIIDLNKFNPQLAARLVTPLSRWKRYGSTNQVLLLSQLNRIAMTEGLSPDVYEVVSRSIGAKSTP